MTPKGSYDDDPRSALRELIERSEEVVNVFVEELTGSSSLRQELGKTLERANLARKTVDRNLEAVLSALNLPTRRDYQRLVEEIHALQGSIVNLNMKMDRLLAATTSPAAPARPAALGSEIAERARPVRSSPASTPAEAMRPTRSKRSATKKLSAKKQSAKKQSTKKSSTKKRSAKKVGKRTAAKKRARR